MKENKAVKKLLNQLEEKYSDDDDCFNDLADIGDESWVNGVDTKKEILKLLDFAIKNPHLIMVDLSYDDDSHLVFWASEEAAFKELNALKAKFEKRS